VLVQTSSFDSTSHSHAILKRRQRHSASNRNQYEIMRYLLPNGRKARHMYPLDHWLLYPMASSRYQCHTTRPPHTAALPIPDIYIIEPTVRVTTARKAGNALRTQGFYADPRRVINCGHLNKTHKCIIITGFLFKRGTLRLPDGLTVRMFVTASKFII